MEAGLEVCTDLILAAMAVPYLAASESNFFPELKPLTYCCLRLFFCENTLLILALVLSLLLLFLVPVVDQMDLPIHLVLH